MNKTKLITLKSILDESIERDKKNMEGNAIITDSVIQNMMMSAIIDAILGKESKRK